MRTMALTFTNPVDAAFAYSLYFGTLLPVDLIVKSSSRKPPIISPIIISDHHKDWTDVDEGWFYGEWETGPWHGFHTKEKAFGAYGWV